MNKRILKPNSGATLDSSCAISDNKNNPEVDQNIGDVSRPRVSRAKVRAIRSVRVRIYVGKCYIPVIFILWRTAGILIMFLLPLFLFSFCLGS